MGIIQSPSILINYEKPVEGRFGLTVAPECTAGIFPYFDHHFPIQQTKIKYSNKNEWINNAFKEGFFFKYFELKKANEIVTKNNLNKTKMT